MSSFCPSSLVNPRLSSKSGGSNGGGAPLVVGEGVQRGPPRNRSPLAVSFPRFFSAKRNGVAPQREKPSSCFRPRRSGRFSERAADSPLACAIRPPCPVASGGPISLSGKEIGERNRQREPIPKAVPFGILPHRPGGCGPLEIPRSLRGTGDEGRGLDGENGLPQPVCAPASQ